MRKRDQDSSHLVHSEYLGGYTYLLNELTYSPTSSLPPVGGLVSTAADYANFVMLANGGEFNGNRILSQESTIG